MPVRFRCGKNPCISESRRSQDRTPPAQSDFQTKCKTLETRGPDLQPPERKRRRCPNERTSPPCVPSPTVQEHRRRATEPPAETPVRLLATQPSDIRRTLRRLLRWLLAPRLCPHF